MKYTLLILLIPIWFSGLAQSDFRRAYIITNSDDTIHGFVDYRNDFQNHE